MHINIQFLRAFAALMVMLHHMMPHLVLITPMPTLQAVGAIGYIGVDLFFVISGFVVTKSAIEHANDKASIYNFTAKRLIRIYPSYWLALLGTTIVGVLTQRNFEVYDWWASITLTSTNLFSLVLPVSWSLTYELYFYALLIPVLLFKQRGLNALLVILPLSLAIGHGLQWSTLTGFALSPFVGEFLLGACICRYRGAISRNSATLALCTVALFTCIALTTMWNPNMLWLRLISAGGFGAACVCLALWLEENNHVLRRSFFVQLGDASYLVYLWHLIFIDLMYFSGARQALSSTEMGLGAFIYFAASLAFLKACIGAHQKLEAPMNAFLQRKILRRPRRNSLI